MTSTTFSVGQRDGEEGTTSMPIRGIKRKAPEASPASPRKSCARISLSEECEDGLSNKDDDCSRKSDSDDEENSNHSISTPITPQSSGSPRYPSNEKSIPCTFDGCKKLFNRHAKLVQHLRSHTNTRPFTCPHSLCTKAYLRDTHLQAHIKSAHSQIRDYVCTWEDCGKAFANGTRYRRHLAAHEGKATRTCTIDGCGLVFRKHSTLEEHIKKVHEGIKPHICQFVEEDGKMCAMGFDKPTQLRAHEGRKHSRNSYECMICSPFNKHNLKDKVLAFPTYSALQEHIKIEHPPTCEQCGLACTSNSALKSHVEVVHGGTSLEERQKFLCPEQGCGQGFTKKGNMKAHVMTAHQNRRFVCGGVDTANLNHVEGWSGSDACGQGFTSKERLQEHIRTVHLGLESKFKRKSRNLLPRAKHAPSTTSRLTGAGDDLVPCHIVGCIDYFATNHGLATHLQARHGLADAEIQDLLSAEENERPVLVRPGFQCTRTFADMEDFEAENAFDTQMIENEDPSRGGSFWLGGANNDRVENVDDWLYDEQEMRRLINDDLYGVEDVEEGVEQDCMDIDPGLV